METLKTSSEYSVDFNRGFQGFSMANLETGNFTDNPNIRVDVIMQNLVDTVDHCEDKSCVAAKQIFQSYVISNNVAFWQV